MSLQPDWSASYGPIAYLDRSQAFGMTGAPRTGLQPIRTALRAFGMTGPPPTGQQLIRTPPGMLASTAQSRTPPQPNPSMYVDI